jgi:hypothetical protein
MRSSFLEAFFFERKGRKDFAKSEKREKFLIRHCLT